jgi:NAD(P)-dependent dehydrogenase (short-subunit alcohol dehydrogenase family)
MGRLEDKVCIITGATSSGIGEKAVEVFLAEGAHVVFAGRRALEGEAVQKRLGGIFHKCDVTQEAEIKQLIVFTKSKFGRVDCFFSNAGGSGPTEGIAGVDCEAYRECMAVNLDSVVFSIKHCAPIMRKQGGGSFISTASVAGHSAGLSSSMM